MSSPSPTPTPNPLQNSHFSSQIEGGNIPSKKRSKEATSKANEEQQSGDNKENLLR